MGDIIRKLGTSLPEDMQFCYRDMGNGTFAPIHAVVLVKGDRTAEITEDGELWGTVAERENDVWVVYAETGLNATKYVCLVDLDGAQYPHRLQNQGIARLDITLIHCMLEMAVNSSGALMYGVVVRIDDTDADIAYFTSVPFLTGVNQEDRTVSLHSVPSQVKLDCKGGALLHGLTSIMESAVTAVNTGVKLDSPLGAATVTPAVGDLVMKYEHSAGSMNFGTLVFYHGHEVEDG